MEGTDAWEPRPAAADGDFARTYLAHRAGAAGQDADVGVRLQRLGRASPARRRAQPVEHRPHRRRVVVGFRGVRRGRRGADRARQRRRRLDPDPGVLQRAGRAQAVARPAAAGQARCARCRSASSPTAWSPARCATPRRSTARSRLLWRNPKLPPIGDVTGPDERRLRIAVFTKSIVREASPEMRELRWKTAALLEGLGHRVDRDRQPGARVASSTTSCSTGRCWRSRWCAAASGRSGRASTAPSWTTSPSAWSDMRGPQSAPAAAGDRPPGRTRRRHRNRVTGLRRAAHADAGRGDAARSGISTRPPTTTRSSTGSSTGSRSRRCRTSPVTRRSRCRSAQSASRAAGRDDVRRRRWARRPRCWNSPTNSKRQAVPRAPDRSRH